MLNLKTLKKYPAELSLTLSIVIAYVLDIRFESSLIKLIALIGVVYVSYTYSKVSALLSVFLFFIMFRYLEGMKNSEGVDDSNEDEEKEEVKDDFEEPPVEEEECEGERDENGKCILDVEEAFRNM